MNFKKKLFYAVGPLITALLIVCLIFLLPLPVGSLSAKQKENYAVSLNRMMFKGNRLKNETLEDPKYVPFFGSSELSRMNSFHPSVLAEKYHREYRPFLLGTAGTQSLIHFSMLQSMGNQLEGRKAVLIISPQWFVSEGVGDNAFSQFFSPLQTYQWLVDIDNVTISDQYYAKRLLEFPTVKKTFFLKECLEHIAKGQPLTPSEEMWCAISKRVLSREDTLFSLIPLSGKRQLIDQSLKDLPKTYDRKTLDQLAYEQGEKKTTNNSFEIRNAFYKKRIQRHLEKLKGAQKDFDYRFSPEFADFELMLEKFAELKMDVLFVIPPVNQRWSDYTGLSQEMLREFTEKITYQLESQGFDHIINMMDQAGENYFMEDTIHLGWRGWLALDDAVVPFVKQPAATTNYHMNPFFFTKEWQEMPPDKMTQLRQEKKGQ